MKYGVLEKNTVQNTQEKTDAAGYEQSICPTPTEWDDHKN